VRSSLPQENPMNTSSTNADNFDLPTDFYPDLCRTINGRRILCVEENECVRNKICSVLVKQGWDCESAVRGHDALQTLISCPQSIDILITKHRLPEMNGTEFVRRVRARTIFTGKILVRSKKLRRKEQAAYKELEVDAFVPNSGSTKSILKAVEELHADKHLNIQGKQ
jgi:CheY-like chemotaxis protein